MLYSFKNSGFTLLELLLVLAIAGLMTAIAVPNLQPMLARMQLQSAVQDVASGLRYARGQALISGRERTFLLDVEHHFYKLSAKHKSYGLPESVQLELFTAEQEIADDAAASIRFFPDGSSTGGRVTLTASGRKRWVDVNWLTGAVIIRE